MRGIKEGFRDYNQNNSIIEAILQGRAENSHLEFQGKEISHKDDFDRDIDQSLNRIRDLRIGITNIMHKHMVVEEKWKLCFHVGGLTPSYKRSHHGYMMNITSCCWNIMESGHL
jgi:hypothetical protein